MAMIAPVAAAAFSTPLVALSTTTALAGTALNVVSQRREARYRTAVAQRQMQIEQENMRLAREAARTEARDQDEAALAVLSEELAQAGARGFDVNSRSYVDRRANLRRLARRDRIRLVDDGERQARNAANRAETARMEGSQARRSSFFSLLEGGLSATGNLIGGARLAGELASRRVTNSARTIS